ncbi:MAG: mechanosensitive ion channel family protein [Thermotogae bacterium]|nr:mechanosensitive ion channel family protein [Thermotogota bacterium]
MKSKRTKAELFKIIAEIVAGIVLVILLGFLTDRILTEFFPKYKVYEPLINESVRSIIVVVIGFMVTSTIIKYIESKMESKKASYGVVTMMVRIAMYIVIIAIVLSIFQISITGVLAGSTIGGVILGFAVQTVASNFLSGVFATSSRTIKYGDIIGINSWIWGNQTIGKVVDIKTFFSKVITKDKNVISIPNSALMGNSVLTEYKTDDEPYYIYPLSITTYADVPSDKIIDGVKKILDDVEIYLNTKSGMTNVFLVLFKFHSIEELNKKMDEINLAFDNIYWKVKSASYVYGNQIFFDLKDKDGFYLYPLNVTLNSDVQAEKILSYVNKSKPELNVYLSNKNGSTNVFSIMIKYKDIEEIPDLINKINLIFDTAYISEKV